MKANKLVELALSQGTEPVQKYLDSLEAKLAEAIRAMETLTKACEEQKDIELGCVKECREILNKWGSNE